MIARTRFIGITYIIKLSDRYAVNVGTIPGKLQQGVTIHEGISTPYILENETSGLKIIIWEIKANRTAYIIKAIMNSRLYLLLCESIFTSNGTIARTSCLLTIGLFV